MSAYLLVLLFVGRTLPWLVRRHRLLFRGQLRPPLGGLVGFDPGVVEVGQIAHDPSSHDPSSLLVLIAERSLQDAVRLEQRRFRIVEPLQRRQRPSVFSEVVGYLLDLYDAWGKPEKAAEWRAKLGEPEEEPGSE